MFVVDGMAISYFLRGRYPFYAMCDEQNAGWVYGMQRSAAAPEIPASVLAMYGIRSIEALKRFFTHCHTPALRLSNPAKKVLQGSGELSRNGDVEKADAVPYLRFLQ